MLQIISISASILLLMFFIFEIGFWVGRVQGIRDVRYPPTRRTVVTTKGNRMSDSEEIMRVALQRIAKWFGEFPHTGRFHEDGSEMSYGYCNGSNGERDYMRQIALEALKAAQQCVQQDACPACDGIGSMKLFGVITLNCSTCHGSGKRR
jgi:hypothetical protein